MSARFDLDFEEWHELYLAATAVPEEERRPCLATAILGIAAVLAEAFPKEMAELARTKRPHDCDDAECQDALDEAVKAIERGEDPFLCTGGDIVEAAPTDADAVIEAIAKKIEEALGERLEAYVDAKTAKR